MSSILDWQINPENNDRCDQNINWREGQPPSSVNNSARGMMARTAEFIQDSFGLIRAEGGPAAYSARIFMDIKKLDPRITFDCIFAKRPTENATLNLNGLGALPLLRRAELMSGDHDQSGFAPFVGNDVLVGVPYHVRFIAAEYLKGYPKGAFFIADAESKPIFLKEEGFYQDNKERYYQKFYYKKDGLVRQWGIEEAGKIGHSNVDRIIGTISYIKPFRDPILPIVTFVRTPKCEGSYTTHITMLGPSRNSFYIYFYYSKWTTYMAATWQATAYEPD